MKKLFTFFIILLPTILSAQIVLTNMPKPDANVWAIVKDGNTVYIAGDFLNVNGISRPHLASFDCTTGALSSWNPAPDRSVYALGIAGGKLMAAGEFGFINTQTRNGVCMFDLSTGNLDSWTAGIHSPYLGKSVGTFNNSFYFCGPIGNGSGLQKIYEVDAITSAFTGWESDSTVFESDAIIVSGNYVWTGGDDLKRFNINTGVGDSWNPALSSSAFITSMASINSIVYIGGSYTTIDGQSRNGLSAFDSTGTLLPFTIQSSSSQVWSMFPYGNFLWVGGNSSSYGGLPRYRMAQFDVATQLATCWNPSSFSSGWSFVNSILVSGDTIYAGPGFPSSANDYLTVSKATCIGTGITENNSENNLASVFPNPSIDEFNLQLNFSLTNPVSIVVYDLTGREIESHFNISPLENYSFGKNLKADQIYIVKIIDGEKYEVIKAIKDF
jgi:hypothetical protein